MANSNVYVNYNVEKQEVELLKKEKIKLEELYNKIEQSKTQLINSNLSGKTNDSCVNNNEKFLNKIKARINTLESLITKLDHVCKSYENEFDLIRSSLADDVQKTNIVSEGGKGWIA